MKKAIGSAIPTQKRAKAANLFIVTLVVFIIVILFLFVFICGNIFLYSGKNWFHELFLFSSIWKNGNFYYSHNNILN